MSLRSKLERISKLEKPTPYELISLILSFFTLLAVGFGLWSLSLAARQVEEAAAAVASTAWGTVHSHQLEVNKQFIERPHLRPYFFSCVDIDETHKDYKEAISLADLHLDFFDSYLGQEKHLPADVSSKHHWHNFIRGTFASSPLMCKRLSKVQMEDSK